MQLHFHFKNKVPMTMSNPVITFPFLNNPCLLSQKIKGSFKNISIFPRWPHYMKF